MNILLVASEVVPFAKTGGLADVAGALPRALEALGQSISVVMPCYAQARATRSLEPLDFRLDISIGKKEVSAEVWRAKLPGCNVPLYLIDQPGYFDRPGLYGENGKDYLDNCERFVFFSRAALELAARLDVRWDVVHANDWQTGLVPVYLAETYRHASGLASAGSLFTIHNMAFQGRFWHWDMLLTGLDWKFFNWRQLEFFGDLNLLKAGIVFADLLSTVSHQYAEEIQTPEFGMGLEGLLESRRSDLHGIVNGIDESVWNPASDRSIAATYDVDTFAEGKARCKAALQAEQCLPVRPDVPLFAIVTRLDAQKGLDLVEAVAEGFLRGDVQLMVLGTGHPQYHDFLTGLEHNFPGKVAVRLAFDNALAHRIEAGADIFLMPSRYEPCGLNQLISLKYGTVPIVRATGGLADTVVDTTPETLAEGTATGFSFGPYTPEALAGAIGRALELWPRRDRWNRLVRTGMRQDWSWGRSAREYVKLYETIRDRHAAPESGVARPAPILP